MKRYQVSNECINCRACVEVAKNNFEMGDNKKAYLKKQPDSEQEAEFCEKAKNICPVDAISEKEVMKENNINPILGNFNIKTTLDKFPELKNVLTELSPKFKKMQAPALYNTLARFASFNDAAKVTNVSICEILHTLNKHLGIEDKLLKSMPECVKNMSNDLVSNSEITWEETPERYIYNNNTMEEIVLKVTKLAPQENLVIISVEKPFELFKVITGFDLIYNVEEGREFRVSIFNPNQNEITTPWQERKDKFEIMDVRTMTSDPFDIILKKAFKVEEDDGFVLIQKFEPIPMINMLSELGFEHLTEKDSNNDSKIYFYKTVVEKSEEDVPSEKADAVIQSATPVAYPVIMRLLQSKKIRENINIKELKVWEETEKHLAWISNGKADISFSALITAAKLQNSDIKIPAIFVWDNFVLLSRNKVSSFADLKETDIHTPLFAEAPPVKITKYLIKASGLNPEDYNFVFGKPFGRPEQIYKDFVSGKADTVILREPEASYAIKIMQDRKEDISIISFNEIWNEINPGFGSFPNAGLVLKGEFAKKYPEQTKIFLEELELAIDWVNENRRASAELSFDMMRQPIDRVELFLDRVNFDFVSGRKLVDKVTDYFKILNEHKVVDMKLDDKFFKLFDV